jgi:hypothetical protein
MGINILIKKTNISKQNTVFTKDINAPTDCIGIDQ